VLRGEKKKLNSGKSYPGVSNRRVITVEPENVKSALDKIQARRKTGAPVSIAI
jgi:hypothetical protein